jgi:hypothetical protein
MPCQTKASVQDIQRHLSDLLTLLVRDQDRKVTIPEFGTLRKKPLRDLLGDIQRHDVIGQFSSPLVGNGLGVDQIEMIARHVNPQNPSQERAISSLRSGARTPTPGIVRRNPQRHRGIAVFWSRHMLGELRVLAQPGAIIASLAVLLLMAAGDAAIVIAIKGWPF